MALKSRDHAHLKNKLIFTIDRQGECSIFDVNPQLQSANWSWCAPPCVFLNVHRQGTLCVLQQSVGAITGKTEHEKEKTKIIKFHVEKNRTCWWLRRTISNESHPRRRNFRATQNYSSLN